MRYRRLGKTDLRVSVVGLGTYQFGGTWGKTFTQAEVDAIVGTARDCGINLLDTAECYGMDHLSERLVGGAIASTRRQWIVATKFGHEKLSPTRNRGSFAPDEVRRQLEDSLRALRTEYVDIYQFHSGSNDDFDNDDLWTMLGKHVQAGRIRHLGISVSRRDPAWRTYQTERATDVGASVIQVKYNRLKRDAQTEVLPECLRQDLGVMARVPLASGLLSGRYQDLTTFDPDDARAKKYDAARIARMLEEIDTITSDELPGGMSLSQYALAWCLAHPAVGCVIPGCKTVDHVKGNARAADLELAAVAHHRCDGAQSATASPDLRR